MLYFARLKDAFATSGEILETNASNVGDLLNELRTRSNTWQEELAEDKTFRVAINKLVITNEALLNDGDEVAIFPPVTGG